MVQQYFDERIYGDFDAENKFNRSRQLKESYLGWETPSKFQKLSKYVPESPNIKDESDIERLEEKIKKIEERLDYFENNTICIDGYRNINDKEAEIEIEEFLRQLRDEGASDFSILDIIAGLNLPPDQVNQILEKMIRRKINE